MTLNSRQLPSAMSDIRSGVKAIDQTYNYDNQGNISALTDKQNSAFSLSNMTYDGLDRLTAITSRWGTNIAHVGSISYDKTGNITKYNVGKTNLTYTHTNNRVDKIKNSTGAEAYSFAYDSRGNVTNNKLRTFSFNRANQLDCSALTHQSACATGTNRYIYDGFNRRVKTTDATGISYSMYSQDGTLLFKHKDGFDTNYIYLGKKLIARSEDAFAPQTSGSSRQHNLPFGETVETPKNDVGYTGHKFDTDLGLSYMQQRYYDPAVGVFYSPDPVGFRDVHSFNRYVYANNNPYQYTDPTGMCSEENSGSQIACSLEDALTDVIEPIVEDAFESVGVENVPAEHRDPEGTLAYEAPENQVVTETLAVVAGVIKAKTNAKHRKKTKGANKKDKQQVDDAANQADVKDRKGFGKFIEKEKKLSGRGGSDNFSYGELIDLAKEFKANGGK